MNRMTRLVFEIWTDGSRRMVALRGNLPVLPKIEPPKENPYSYQPSNMDRIWFIMNEDELKRFGSNSYVQLEDGIHRMDVTGDQVTFFDALTYNTDVAHSNHGIARVAFFSAKMPRFFRTYLHRVAKRVWKRIEAAKVGMDQHEQNNVPKVEIEFSIEERERFLKLYGQGSGIVNIDYREYRAEDTKNQIELNLADKSFAQCFDRLKQICLNSTFGHHQTATLRINIDGENRDSKSKRVGQADGFYWEAIMPDGRRTMNGGVINHSRGEEYESGKNDWSIHT